MIDTGAGNHFVGRKHLTPKQLSTLVDVEPIAFITADGRVDTNKAVIVHIDGLDLDVSVYVLEDSLPALSAGMLCRDHGCRLRWAPGVSECELVAPNGKSVVLQMRGACPWLPQGGTSSAAPFSHGGGEGTATSAAPQQQRMFLLSLTAYRLRPRLLLRARSGRAKNKGCPVRPKASSI